MKLYFVLFFSFLLSSDLFSQKAESSYDILRKNIKVPEIDPRQYVVVYEWEPANENKKLKKGLKQSDIINNIQGDETRIRSRLTEIRALIKQSNIRIDELDSTINYTKDSFALISRDGLLLSEQKIFDMKLFEAREVYNLTKEMENLQSKITNFIDDTLLIQNRLSELESKITSLEPNSGYKPYNFLDETLKPYYNNVKYFNEYYNYIAWRNAGTPNWQPIWWLNKYPWPHGDFRNIDLKDKDYNEYNFALLPYQKYKVIDDKAVLRIVFDKQQLALNKDFRGSISIEATLFDGGSGKSGKSDPRPIEINPFSMIGEQKKSIGLLNKPAIEIAGNLLEILILGKTIPNSLNSYTDYFESLGKIQDLRLKQINSLENNLQDKKNVALFNLDKSILCKYYEENNSSDRFICKFDFTDTINAKDSISLIEVFKRVREEIKTNNTDVNKRKTDYYRKLLNFKKDIELFLEYCSIYEKETGNSFDAFIGLLGKDIVEFRLRLANIKSIYIDWKMIVERQSTDNDSVNILKTLNVSLSEEIAKLVRANTNFITQCLNSLGYNKDFILSNEFSKDYVTGLKNGKDFFRSMTSFDKIGIYLTETDMYSQGFYKGYMLKNNDESSFEGDNYLGNNINRSDFDIDSKLIKSNPNDYQRLKDIIAEKAGELLYQDLIYGTIDLDLADARPGDQLYLKMLWNKRPNVEIKSDDSKKSNLISDIIKANDDANRDGVALYVAIFDIENRGWSFTQSDAPVLVKRINESLLPANYPLIPNNFKLTGGVNLMWRLKNDHRFEKKIKTLDGTNLPKFNKYGQMEYNKLGYAIQKTAKWLEPSFGFNLSYLDFSINNPNFEIGIGPCIGLFNNLFNITYGYNLMENSARQPYYWAVGFSFINLGAKIQELTNN